MEVRKTTVNKLETSAEIDLFEGRTLSRAAKERIQDEVGNYLVEQTLTAMNEKKSPIAGGEYKTTLSPLYKKKKIAETGSGEANLEFSGDMKDELGFIPTKNGIDLGVFGDRAPAADGHNNLSGKSHLPERRFLPDVGQDYKGPIKREVDRIIADIIAEETKIKPSMFQNVETKAALYEVLAQIFGPMSRSELKLLVYRNESVLNILEDQGLEGLL